MWLCYDDKQTNFPLYLFDSIFVGLVSFGLCKCNSLILKVTKKTYSTTYSTVQFVLFVSSKYVRIPAH